MTIIDRLLTPLGYTKAKRSSATGSIFGIMSDSSNENEPNFAIMSNQSRAYQQSEITFFCVHQKAKTASSYDFFVSERVEHEEGLQSIPNHPLEMLIQRPNQTMHLSRQQLWISTISHVCIHGNAYWYLEFDGAGEPVSIIPLRPDRVAIIPDSRDYIKGYKYTASGNEVFLKPFEVVHFRNFHPLDDWYGMSDIEASAHSLQGDIHAAKEFNASLINRGVPAMLISSKRPVRKENWDQFKREWRREYDGYNNAGKTAFLEGGEIDAQPISIPFRDLQRLEERTYTQERLMMVHGVPSGLYSKEAIEANAMAAYRTFLRDTIRPLHVMLAEAITTQMAIPFFGEKYVCGFTNCVIDDQNVKLREMEIISNGIIGPGGIRSPLVTPNEFRKLYMGLDPLMEAQPVAAAETEEVVENAGQKPGPKPGVEDVADDERLEEGPQDASKVERRLMRQADLRRWRTKAIKQFRAGFDPAEREFISQWIEPTVSSAIRKGLGDADSIDEIKAVFENEGNAAPAENDSTEEILEQDIAAATASWDRFLPDLSGMLEAASGDAASV